MLDDLRSLNYLNADRKETDKVKKIPAVIIPFLLMHFVYFPILGYEFIFNYMGRNGFFSYELITENFFVVSLTTALTFLMLTAFSFLCWGFPGYFILKKLMDLKSNAFAWLLLAPFISIQFLMWNSIINSESRALYLPIYISSLILCLFYCFYFNAKVKVKIYLVIGLFVLTGYAQLIAGEYTNNFFSRSLYKFGIGGGIKIELIFKDKPYEVSKGLLTLLTQKFVYITTNQSSEIVPMDNIKKIIRPRDKA